MKKIFSAFIIAVCCMFMAMPAQAQLLKWGVKGGVNLTKIDWDGGFKGNKDNSTGFFIGPMAEITIPIVGLGVDGALLFSQRGKSDVKQTGVEVPVNLIRLDWVACWVFILLPVLISFLISTRKIMLTGRKLR